ncbi:MAG: XRE family transcriptional regulator [Fusobacterium necrophorum]|nr:XRE family transcriptional regulator [Fusobacterium necrophorum]
MTLGERVKLKREKMNLSQEELAEKMGYKSKTSIHKIEQGITDLPLSKVSELAKVLKCTPAYLMGWDTERLARNKMVHGFELSKEEKIKLIQSIADKLKKGLSYTEIEEVLEFPYFSEVMQGITVEREILDEGLEDSTLFEQIEDVSISVAKHLFESSGLSFNEDDDELQRETFRQVANKMSLSEMIATELKKYATTSNAKFLEDSQFVSVPVYGRASAGCGCINMETVLYDKVIHINGYSHDSFLIEVSGDSMEPVIFDGEFVLVDPSHAEIEEGKIYVITYNNETFIKKIEEHEEDGIVVLKSINQKYRDRIIKQEEFENVKINGRVVKVISERKL